MSKTPRFQDRWRLYLQPPRESPHDLDDWIKSVETQMAGDYFQIQKRVREDPGTAGSRGEENWAQLLRNWLPSKYPVVTHGRILSQTGKTSPQMDVLVLHPSYPRALQANKLYLAEGVAAAFECKLTVRSRDFKLAVKNCIALSKCCKAQFGSPRKELVRPIVYGLLAHSFDWKGERKEIAGKMMSLFVQLDEQSVAHPLETLDVACIANLATFATSKWADVVSLTGSTGCIVAFDCYDDFAEPLPTPIGSFLTTLYNKLSFQDPELRPLVDIFGTILSKRSFGGERVWGMAPYSKDVRKQLGKRVKRNYVWHDEWTCYMA